MTVQVAAVTPDELMSLADTVTVVDVRRAEELAQEPAPWPSLHVPYDQLAQYRPEPGRRVVTLCRTGPRSVRAAQLLAAAGHDVVGYLDGGVTAMIEATETSLR